MQSQTKPILCIDFDGVIHWYRNGWKGATEIDDIPVPGVREFIARASQQFRVVIYSSRSQQPGGIEAMQAWMEKYDVLRAYEKYEVPTVEFSTEKPSAFVTLDDRAVQFNGTWPDIAELIAFVPWYKKEVAQR